MQYRKNMQCNSIYFEITDMCNLHCSHCYNISGNGKSNYIPYENMVELLDLIDFSKVHRGISVSGGEPLCHPDIFRILTYIHQRKYPTRVITNGILGESVLLPYLLEADSPFSVQMSLDGATRETDDRIRGAGHYEQAVTFMRNACSMGFPRFGVRMTVSRSNVKEIEKLFELCIDNNAVPTFGFVAREGCAAQVWEEIGLSNAEIREISQRINLLYKKYNDFWARRHQVPPVFSTPTTTCEILKSDWIMAPLVKTNGDVQPCHKLYPSVYTLGNIFENQLPDILSPDNPAVVRLKQLLSQRTDLLRAEHCKECIFIRSCEGGCPARSIDNGDFWGLDGDCEYRIRCWLLSHSRKLKEREKMNGD